MARFLTGLAPCKGYHLSKLKNRACQSSAARQGANSPPFRPPTLERATAGTPDVFRTSLGMKDDAASDSCPFVKFVSIRGTAEMLHVALCCVWMLHFELQENPIAMRLVALLHFKSRLPEADGGRVGKAKGGKLTG